VFIIIIIILIPINEQLIDFNLYSNWWIIWYKNT